MKKKRACFPLWDTSLNVEYLTLTLTRTDKKTKELCLIFSSNSLVSQ